MVCICSYTVFQMFNFVGLQCIYYYVRLFAHIFNFNRNYLQLGSALVVNVANKNNLNP